MKTMKKIVCALMTLVLLLSSVPAVFADEADTKTIDQDAACSLTIWKFDYTNAKKDGVKLIPGSQVQYKVLKEGNGPVPKATDKVKVNYEGKLIDGTEFDSSYKRNKPATFECNRVIKGWTEALTHMPVGSTWEIYIPQELAYGAQEQGGKIKPFSALIFKVELLSIEK